jgi:Domain of unknown function (DUF4914)/Cytochrome C assembly protein
LLPSDVAELLSTCKGFQFFNSTEELVEAATNGIDRVKFEVKYEVPGKGEFVEAIIHRERNGISANFTEAYMRRRDPGKMSIADDKPSDKERSELKSVIFVAPVFRHSPFKGKQVTPANKIRKKDIILQLTRLNHLTLIVGLYLMTAGVFLGGIWANESWGCYWGWDPKETWVLVTVLVYAFVTHMYKIPGLRGQFAFNLASFFSYSSVLMTYLE